jgi:23S rRNA (guanosine2251-2'-O)-methyltransferase
MRIITGFHAIEEELRSAEHDKTIITVKGMRMVHSKPGPRVKKILASAAALAIPATEAKDESLDEMVKSLPPTARDHRGIVMILENDREQAPIRFDECVKELADKESALVLILDSITDPHNVGAIIRSADQFGVDLVVLPEHRGATDFEVISRTSAGAAAWVKITIVPNLVRAVESLKDAGFWVYGADAGGTAAPKLTISGKTALVMGSEGTGIARLLREKCDTIVSIPTMGKLDSLNVSVAAGVLLYEIRRNGASKT